LSKRENLRLKLADAIERVLGSSHELSIPNCLRYVKPHLRSFSIGNDIDISLEDWETAIELATLRLAKPIDQPTPLLKRHPIVRPLSDKLLSEGVIIQEDHDHRRRLAEESFTREEYFSRLKSIALASGV
jgi:hypothetical protein